MRSSSLLLLLLLATTFLDGIVGQELATVAIGTFLLELTIQTPQRSLLLLRRSSHHPDNNNNPNTNDTDSTRHLASASTDSLIQKTAERHLSKVYSERFRDASQVLLTVVTANDDGGGELLREKVFVVVFGIRFRRGGWYVWIWYDAWFGHEVYNVTVSPRQWNRKAG